jgi:hypothetical protein
LNIFRLLIIHSGASALYKLAKSPSWFDEIDIAHFSVSFPARLTLHQFTFWLYQLDALQQICADFPVETLVGIHSLPQVECVRQATNVTVYKYRWFYVIFRNADRPSES